MASILLASAGASLGASIGGSVLGVGAATIGGAIGSVAGSVVDSMLVSALAPTQRIEGPRLDALTVTTSTEGAAIPRVYGRFRIGGNVIWATDFREETRTTSEGGGKGGGPRVESTEYLYFASFALALCEGPIGGIGQVWADGKPMDLRDVVYRLYPGDETQAPDPFIEAKTGGPAPAYRGTAYILFEELPLAPYGNRLPQISVEVIRPLAEPDTLEGMVRAVTLIPASGEVVYATEDVRRGSAGATVSETLHAGSGQPDLVVSLDRLEAALPMVESVSLVVAWFGDDLRAEHCAVRPGVESATKTTEPVDWSVSGIARDAAHPVSFDAEGHPVYGGTPSDRAVVQGIRELKARGLRVTFYPFLLMDIPPGNALPNPYSDDAAETGQPAHPWRGRVTCAPAPEHTGTVDKTAAAGDQVAAFFGTAAPGDFAVSGESVTWTGDPSERGLRRMILHYAHLCAAAGGVDAFLVGSEMVGLTTIRDGVASYPAVAALRALAGDVRSILGAGTRISYAADWSEYFGHHPADGSGDVFFHLDPFWADPEVDFVGIDNYLPLADWRDGDAHADAEAGWPDTYDLGYLRANIEGGERYDWYYASAADRAAQVRTPILDGAYGKPWVFRPKDIRSWWANAHHDRPGGVESATPTAWVPESKPIRFTEIGCPAVDRAANQPNVFYDPKSSESALPHHSRGWRDDAIQRRYLDAALGHWAEHNPVSAVYGGPMLALGEAAVWTWDARPYPDFPARSEVWGDAENWRLGHWLTGRAGSAPLAALLRALCVRAGLGANDIDVSEVWQVVEGQAITALESPRASIAVLMRHFGLDAVESGGVLRFRPRGRRPDAMLGPEDLVPPPDGDLFELARGQETELAQALKWQVVRSDAEYDTAAVEARRITVASDRVRSETFALATPPEAAERRCRRALLETWSERETLSARLPPARLALDPGDVVAFAHDGRALAYRITRTADAEARAIEAARQGPDIDSLPAADPFPVTLPETASYGTPRVHLMELPQLSEDIPAHRPYAAVWAGPWYGSAAVWRSAGADGFTRIDTVSRPARLGRLAADLPAGPVWRFDHGAALLIDLEAGTLRSVTDTELFAGANALAVESVPGLWEVLQAGEAELVAPGRYRLTRLLRGQRGTEAAIGAPAQAGAAVVVLDAALQPLSIAEADLGLPWTWRIGPASAQPGDAAVVEQAFTPAGRGLVPFSPVHARARRLANGDLELRWTRRSRALAADSWTLAEVPRAEDSEAYDLEILDAGGAVLRSATVAAPFFTWTAAMQTADLGGPAASLRLRLWQIGALGRGDVLDTFLTVMEAL